MIQTFVHTHTKVTHVQWQKIAPKHRILVRYLTYELNYINLTIPPVTVHHNGLQSPHELKAPGYNKPEQQKNAISIMYVVNIVFPLYSENRI